MANIFKQNLDVTQHPNLNNHDLTHKVHGTYKMGVLYPFLCKPVVPSDSFRIDTACGFQLMPMPFPTQSNIRCIFHYFYVRNKNIWENWETWLQGLEEHTPPYINQPADYYKTGSLADYLDIPTTLVDGSSRLELNNDARPVYMLRGTPNKSFFFGMSNAVPPLVSSNAYVGFRDVFQTGDSTEYPWATFISSEMFNPLDTRIEFTLDLINPDIESSGDSFPNACTAYFGLVGYPPTDLPSSAQPSATGFYSNIDKGHIVSNSLHQMYTSRTQRGFVCSFNVNERLMEDYRLLQENGFEKVFVCVYIGLQNSSATGIIPFFSYTASFLERYPIYLSSARFDFIRSAEASVYDLPNIPQFSPYYCDYNQNNEDTVKVSALPFRAYESIYRAYYANSVMQPLKINGQTKYNRYNTELGDGADNTRYELFQRNWELDAYTSCLPSPQQGSAPLVGMNVLGEVTIQDPDNGSITTARANVDGQNVDVEVTSPIQSVEHGRTLVNLLNTGFSIADLRQTNNLTRFLEQSIRSGYRYIDFIKGQFGYEPKYAELDMPEFLGGFSQRVDVNMVTNNNGVVPTDSDVVLGSFAGQGRAFGGSEHGISRKFDDYGWVIGIMCIVPDASYSQLLPKHFTYNNRLDYYFPLFSEIGLQPITYSEVSPIQSHKAFVNGDAGSKLTDTFGYQRPNHEYVWYPDTLHGQFRTSLNNILINRIFANRPQLGDEFLKINPEETNNIFSVTEEDNDVVVGQIVVKITAKRPIPRIVIPGLGR